MGGRGSWSAGSKGEVDVGDAKELASGIGGGIIGPEETRGDIKRMSELASFKDVDGTGDIPTAILGAQMLQLQNLEQRFGAVKAGDVEMLSAPVGRGGTVAAVAYQPFTGAQTLMLNSDYFKNAGQMHVDQLASEHSGWNMPTNGTVKEAARYAITHEYGHMLHNELYNKAKANGYKGTRFWRSVILTGNQTPFRFRLRTCKFWRSVILTGNQTLKYNVLPHSGFGAVSF